LNVIDTLREANRPTEALQWVTKTRQRFAGTAVETNAMFAALRLYVAEDQFADAVNIAEQLLQRSFSKAVLTSRAEVAYLRAFSLEHAGRKEEAVTAYLTVPDSIESYYGWLASQRLAALAGKARADLYARSLGMRVVRVVSVSENGSYGAPPPAPPPMPMMAAAERSYTKIEPGEQKLQVTVSMVFELQ